MPRKLRAYVILTYRCNARCAMCGCHAHPSDPAAEITLNTLRKLPSLSFVNLTGGEPFLRRDLEDVVALMSEKSERIVISTNGTDPERILALCARFPHVGIRISLEGLAGTSDRLRGLPGGFDRAMATLNTLHARGHRDIGIGMTVQDENYQDLLPLYHLAQARGLEFATAAAHNSFYFHTDQNKFDRAGEIATALDTLSGTLLASPSPKNWLRAYFNHSLADYVRGQRPPLPCRMGQDAFFIDPFGDVLPCNGMREKTSMGNLCHTSFSDCWRGPDAARAREAVRRCDRPCWMVCGATASMRRYPAKPLLWIAGHKLAPRGRV